jgi:hypothetical protein
LLMPKRTNRLLCEASFVTREHFKDEISVEEAIECTKLLLSDLGLKCRAIFRKSYHYAYYIPLYREVVFCRSMTNIGTVLHEVAHALDDKINKPRFKGNRRSVHDNPFYHGEAVVYSKWYGKEFKHVED